MSKLQCSVPNLSYLTAIYVHFLQIKPIDAKLIVAYRNAQSEIIFAYVLLKMLNTLSKYVICAIVLQDRRFSLVSARCHWLRGPRFYVLSRITPRNEPRPLPYPVQFIH